MSILINTKRKEKTLKIKTYRFDERKSEAESIAEVTQYINDEIVSDRKKELFNVQFVYDNPRGSGYISNICTKALIMYYEISLKDDAVTLNDDIED